MKRTRRLLVVTIAALAAACTGAAQAAPYVMYRDAGCGCCMEWAAHVRNELGAEVIVREDRPMAEVKQSLGVPADLVSCHTMEVEGYTIEGHVPAREIERLLAERPAGVTGLAVAGMPAGSPGMEMAGRSDTFEVIAFGPGGRTVYASYP